MDRDVCFDTVYGSCGLFCADGVGVGVLGDLEAFEALFCLHFGYSYSLW